MQQSDATSADLSPNRKLQIANRKSSPLNDLLRATFLASSWTWVIGMFLPVLLVREYGVWASAIFAVPNCVGAAAMGWTVRTPQQSHALVAAHASACRAFSLVTIAFHAFFVFWLLVPWMRLTGLLPGAFLAIFAFLTMRTSGVGLAALLTYIYSLICAALFLGEAGPSIVHTEPQPAATLAISLIALAPVCLFGFALNPYLDLTFHAARQASASDRGARVAFGVGFCGLFLAMILFTVAYSGVLWRDVMDSATQGRPPLSDSPVWFVAGHILFQAAFTTGIHIASVSGGGGGGGGGGTRGRAARHWLGIVAAVAVGVAAAWWARRSVYAYRGEMLAGELVYRLFMSFYGLWFPAYAWLCMLPTWRNPLRPSRRSLAAFVAAVVLAAPFYWIAFIGGRMVWALVGILIVLLSRFVIAGRPQGLDKA